MYSKQNVETKRANLSAEKLQLLRQRLRGESASETVDVIPQRAIKSPAPLSFAQARLWFLFEWEPTSPAYNESHNIRFTGNLNQTALQQALIVLAQRHEILRTTYDVVEGDAMQIIQPEFEWSLPTIDLSGLPLAAREEAAVQIALTQAALPFDIRHELPWRAILLRYTPELHDVVFTQHHISCDGWSFAIRERELATIYRAFAVDRTPNLPQLPIQYADFAVWQRAQFEAADQSKLLDYWREKLAELTPLPLPTDHKPRVSEEEAAGALHHHLLPSAFMTGLSDIGRNEHVSEFVVALTAFKVLLARLTHQYDVSVGSIVTSRERPELEQLLGFFAETVVLRSAFTGEMTFRDAIQCVNTTTLEAYRHKAVTVDHIIAGLRLQRDAFAFNPLFQVLFTWQDWQEQFSDDGSALDMEIATQRRTANDTAKFDLSLTLEKLDDLFECAWEYNAEIFTEETVTRFAVCFERLLGTVLTDPDRPLRDLPLLNESERDHLLHGLNTSQQPPCDSGLVYEQIAEQAVRQPDGVALVSAEINLTYAQLNERSNQLAHHLLALGVSAETPVAIALPRSANLVIALLAVLKAGGTCLPLDPNHPAKRVEAILDATQTTLLITHQELLPFVEKTLHRVQLDADQSLLADLPTTNPAIAVNVKQAAYLLFTSGSTGIPKGVVLEHQSLNAYAITATDRFEIAAHDHVLQFASAGFDTSIEEIYPCLMRGATLVLRSDEMLGSAKRFFDFCDQHGVSVLDLPTAYWHQLCQEMAAGDGAFAASVRLVIIGGERALPERWQQWQAHAPATTQLVNTYGPTEGTVVAIAADLGRYEATDADEVPLGQAIDNVKTYVLDAYLAPVPIGVHGELYIGGAGITRGYWEQGDLTAERYVPDPFGALPGARLYRTGDVVRHRTNGDLQYIGRSDHQIKIRGFRIEPNEVASVAREHELVAQCVVMARLLEDRGDDYQLVAYVVPTEPDRLTTAGLREFLQDRLPPYMVPAYIVLLETLPLTVSGKIDRQALPLPERTDTAATEYVAPSTLSEEVLVELWMEVLGVEQVGVNDDFFELGGHSMLAIQLMAQIQDAFQVELSLQLLFRQPTVAELAVAIDELLLAEIEGLSEEDVLRMLAEESGDD